MVLLAETCPLHVEDSLFPCHDRQYVAASLTEGFYNHAALALSDSRAYCDMAALARDKFALPVAPPRLSGKTPEQGKSHL